MGLLRKFFGGKKEEDDWNPDFEKQLKRDFGLYTTGKGVGLLKEGRLSIT